MRRSPKNQQDMVDANSNCLCEEKPKFPTIKYRISGSDITSFVTPKIRLRHLDRSVNRTIQKPVTVALRVASVPVYTRWQIHIASNSASVGPGPLSRHVASLYLADTSSGRHVKKSIMAALTPGAISIECSTESINVLRETSPTGRSAKPLMALIK